MKRGRITETPASGCEAPGVEMIESLLSLAVGFPCEIRPVDFGHGKTAKFQALPNLHLDDEMITDFFDWCLTFRRQWHDSPIEAATALLWAWESYQSEREGDRCDE